MPDKRPPKTSIGKAMNTGVEMVSGVLAGVGMGLLFDWLLGTSPWGLIIFFVLGSAAGMMNVIRSVMPKKDKDETGHKDG